MSVAQSKSYSNVALAISCLPVKRSGSSEMRFSSPSEGLVSELSFGSLFS